MALVRVKRRAQDDPIDVLLLSCKKFKAAEDSVSTFFKFHATVNEQDGDVKTLLNQAAGVPKVPLKYRKNDVTSITEKLRAENKLFSQNSRLKVVNCFRAIDSQPAEGGLEDVDDGKALTVVDIESAPPTREAPKGLSNSEVTPSTEEQYVYDLYYSQVGDFDDLLLENVLSAHEVDEKLFFGDLAGNGSDNDSNVYDDEEDSNDENNWRNDYPDEEEADDESSLDEEDMRLAMGIANVNINGERESDLSSDREDEALIYGGDDRRGYYYETATDSDSDFYK